MNRRSLFSIFPRSHAPAWERVLRLAEPALHTVAGCSMTPSEGLQFDDCNQFFETPLPHPEISLGLFIGEAFTHYSGSHLHSHTGHGNEEKCFV